MFNREYDSLIIDNLDKQIKKYERAIRQHRDARGDDRCWMDDEELYKMLPEGYVVPNRDTEVELAACEKYINCRHNPATTYLSPQRRIEELERKLMDIQHILDSEYHDDKALTQISTILLQNTG